MPNTPVHIDSSADRAVVETSAAFDSLRSMVSGHRSTIASQSGATYQTLLQFHNNLASSVVAFDGSMAVPGFVDQWRVQFPQVLTVDPAYDVKARYLAANGLKAAILSLRDGLWLFVFDQNLQLNAAGQQVDFFVPITNASKVTALARCDAVTAAILDAPVV
jgi:hypothetical protein